MAKNNAIGLYRILMKKYPFVGDIDPDHWDFILITASVFIAVSQLNHENIEETKKEKIRKIVIPALLEKYPDGARAFDDCHKFYDRTMDGLAKEKEYQQNPQYISADSLGCWIVWNLYGRKELNDEESKLIRVLGGMIINGFVSWWK